MLWLYLVDEWNDIWYMRKKKICVWCVNRTTSDTFFISAEICICWNVQSRRRWRWWWRSKGRPCPINWHFVVITIQVVSLILLTIYTRVKWLNNHKMFLRHVLFYYIHLTKVLHTDVNFMTFFFLHSDHHQVFYRNTNIYFIVNCSHQTEILIFSVYSLYYKS